MLTKAWHRPWLDVKLRQKQAEGLDTVYCIVTYFLQWNFLRNSNDKVETEECFLVQTPDGPRQESLKVIAEKIYVMLSIDSE